MNLEKLSSVNQIRFIYYDKKLNPNDRMALIINENIEPPLTMQIYIEPEKQQNDRKVEDSVQNINSCCYLM